MRNPIDFNRSTLRRQHLVGQYDALEYPAVRYAKSCQIKALNDKLLGISFQNALWGSQPADWVSRLTHHTNDFKLQGWKVGPIHGYCLLQGWVTTEHMRNCQQWHISTWGDSSCYVAFPLSSCLKFQVCSVNKARKCLKASIENNVLIYVYESI